MNTSTSAPGEGTFQLEESLPSLPLPPLDKTLQRYLESTEPFLTKEEYRHTKEIVQEFGQGIGKELHRKLQEKASNTKNWVEKWWEELAYLSNRSPLAIQCNMYGVSAFQNNIWPPIEGTQCQRTAIVAWYMLDYHQQMRREEVPVDKARSGMLFSMNQLRGLFNCSRIPGENADKLIRYFRTEREGPCPNHIAVFCNGHIYILRPFSSNGTLMSAQQLSRQLLDIKELSKVKGQCLAALTADDRTSFAKSYKHLCSLSPSNVAHLEAVAQCVFVIALEDQSPKTHCEYVEMTIKGDPYSRWNDKSYCLLGFNNGVITVCGDHCPFDGMVVVMLNTMIHHRLLHTSSTWPTPEVAGVTFEPQEELLFTVDGATVRAMDKGAKTHDENASNLQVFCSPCSQFGKKWTKEHKLHPDTVYQLALLNAYYKLHNKPVPMYETATTRQFYHGRTETLRSCTSEAVRWCRAMVDPDKTTSERLTLFLEAVRKHDSLMASACNGEGCDRHLFGLQATAMEQGLPMPTLYTDPAYSKSGGGGNFAMSTSCAGYSNMMGCVAPMCHDGYGAFYSISEEGYHTSFLAFKSCEETDVYKMFLAVNTSLADIHRLVLSHSKM